MGAVKEKGGFALTGSIIALIPCIVMGVLTAVFTSHPK
jgi:hypothetical protein